MVKCAKKVITAFLLAATVLVAVFSMPAFSSASASSSSDIEESNVWDDLQGSTINGRTFDIEDYPLDSDGDLKVIAFVEYGYSVYASNQDDYALYVYVYNPQILVIDESSVNNKIQFVAGTLETAKYTLKFLNYSNAAGYEGLFYKFKVSLTSTVRRSILNNLTSSARVYKVSGIEVFVNSATTEYSCGQTFTYTGYSLGYGTALALEDTLTCTVDAYTECVELEVKHTVYRPEGDYYNGEQSQLNSCYFRVPEKYFTSYGELSRIKCEWWEYLTNWFLVTEDNYLYRYLDALKGGDVTGCMPSGIEFTIAALTLSTDPYVAYEHPLVALDNAAYIPTVWFSSWDTYDELAYYHYYWEADVVERWLYLNNDPFLSNDEWFSFGTAPNWDITRLYSLAGVFYTGSGVSYEDRSVSASEVKEKLLSYSASLGAPYYYGASGSYSQALFADELIDEDHTMGYNIVDLYAEDYTDIYWNVVTNNYFLWMYSGKTVETIRDVVDTVYTVTEDDLEGSDADIAARLYIAEADVDDLKSEWETAEKNGERLILLRYSSNTYRSLPVVSTYKNVSGEDEEDVDDVLFHAIMNAYHYDEFDGYIAQETVFLDFDIIALYFTDLDVTTEIAVVSSPTDVISGLTSPLEESSSGGCTSFSWYEWLIIAAIVVVAIIALLVLFPVLVPVVISVLRWILKAVIFILSIPFRLMKSAGKAIQRRRKERRDNPKPPKPPKPPKETKPKKAKKTKKRNTQRSRGSRPPAPAKIKKDMKKLNNQKPNNKKSK